MRSRILPLLLLLATCPALAAEWAGTVKAASGSVEVEREGKRLPLALGDKVYPQDKLLTGKNSQVAVTLRDDTLISGGPDSQLLINEFVFNPSTQKGSVVVAVLRGVSAFVSGLVAKSSPDAMRVTTPTATLGIRGTEFIVEVAN
ncbi:hypothetical protein DLREEDagrD3_14680 [Denitratisoma sp. agr-D3]